ncbi:MAG: hypothetical protein ACRDU4_04730 [Mycobacterium sp.]
MPVTQAIRLLVERFGCSARQARRYVEQAARGGRVAVPESTMVFTIKLQVGLVGRVRAYAASSGRTISAVVAEALEEFLTHRGGRPKR